MTVATAPHAGTASATTGTPTWLPAGAALERHDVDAYGVRSWVYALPGPAPDDIASAELTIVAVATATLRAPEADLDLGFETAATTIDANPGSLLTHRGGGLVRLDFLRDGIAYTVFETRPTTTATKPTVDEITQIAEGLTP